MARPYLLEWDSVSYPPKFKPPRLHTYDGKSSPNQHIYYFRSQFGNLKDNDVMMDRLFIGKLKRAVFVGSGTCQLLHQIWIDLETQFLSQFYEDDTEVTMDKLLLTV